jgi:hypothetical protein
MPNPERSKSHQTPSHKESKDSHSLNLSDVSKRPLHKCGNSQSPNASNKTFSVHPNNRPNLGVTKVTINPAKKIKSATNRSLTAML